MNTSLENKVVLVTGGTSGIGEVAARAGAKARCDVDVVEDCCGATSPVAEEAALSRLVQAGAVRLATIGALIEFQRD